MPEYLCSRSLCQASSKTIPWTEIEVRSAGDVWLAICIAAQTMSPCKISEAPASVPRHQGLARGGVDAVCCHQEVALNPQRLRLAISAFARDLHTDPCLRILPFSVLTSLSVATWGMSLNTAAAAQLRLTCVFWKLVTVCPKWRRSAGSWDSSRLCNCPQ